MRVHVNYELQITLQFEYFALFSRSQTQLLCQFSLLCQFLLHQKRWSYRLPKFYFIHVTKIVGNNERSWQYKPAKQLLCTCQTYVYAGTQIHGEHLVLSAVGTPPKTQNKAQLGTTTVAQIMLLQYIRNFTRCCCFSGRSYVLKIHVICRRWMGSYLSTPAFGRIFHPSLPGHQPSVSSFDRHVGEITLKIPASRKQQQQVICSQIDPWANGKDRI